MPGHGEKLGRKQEQAIAALLAEPTVEKAAATAGVPYRTLKSWLTRPDFLAAYRRARDAVVEEAVVVLQKLTTSAAVALGRNLTCGTPGVEVRAALAVFDTAFKAAELLDLVGRLEELERRDRERQEREKAR
jgi:hypothetical protein